ncbi:L-asparaginase [Saccharopolyspora erythraea NRRL 2338]|uniref:L-asparaginase II n=2 Tax=Saccharopolyspora erythraea TaxID=1836 RepID=A4FFR4_SACEN|nr:asparaginase [Saccharopolyspora erythraea]EQD82432.1 L-asparaginase [Saccharopolyspora erythraea D]PFG96607.1 L-asparaginase [Saccharopolyspora erythraea NRRL 2338]QRK93082.1 asparaginase [Saccharopolyspora erythraea]CAM02889.1 L-asparaginase II precursor [Saccharopolyspora erythraea NRRL 2338]
MTRVLLVATGDTLAYRKSGPSIASGAELLADLPGAVAAEVGAEDVMAEPSWDTSPSTMLALARRVRAAVLEDGYDGVVVTHGLDTLEETAFLTDLTAGPAAGRAAIVFTGAGFGWDEPEGHGPANLTASLRAAADPALRGQGAVVCAGDQLHAARWARLTDPWRAASFTSGPHPRLGHLVDGRVELLGTAPQRPPRTLGLPETDVALIRTHPGMTPMLLTAAVDAGARGVVLEGTGMGNVPVDLFTAISELVEWDIPVVIATRGETRVLDLDQLPLGTGLAAEVGAIGARDLSASHARIALMAALSTGGVAAVRDWFGRL